MNAGDIVRERVDVLIVGLGPAGGAAAAGCARAGLNVLAIDKRQRIGEPVQCAEFIPLPLARYAQADGVAVQRIGGMKTFLPSGAVHAAALMGMTIDRAAFDRGLVAEAQCAGATVRCETHLLHLDASLHRARIKAGAAEYDIGYRILIAADGPHSTVAKCLRLPPLAIARTRQYTVPLHAAYADTDIWLGDDFPGGYAWLFPKGTVANIGVGVDPRFAADLPDLKTQLARVHARAVARGIVGEKVLRRTGGAIPIGGLRGALVQDRTLFVGDAAGLTHPISGAGIAAAVISGERAAKAAIEFIHDGDAAAFARFEEDIREQFAHTLARAVARRAQLAGVWRTPAARTDAPMRRGWIAFPEYFAQ